MICNGQPTSPTHLYPGQSVRLRNFFLLEIELDLIAKKVPGTLLRPQCLWLFLLVPRNKLGRWQDGRRRAVEMCSSGSSVQSWLAGTHSAKRHEWRWRLMALRNSTLRNRFSMRWRSTRGYGLEVRGG